MCKYDDGDCCGVGNNTDFCSNCSCNATGKFLVLLKFQIDFGLFKMVLAMSKFYLGKLKRSDFSRIFCLLLIQVQTLFSKILGIWTLKTKSVCENGSGTNGKLIMAFCQEGKCCITNPFDVPSGDTCSVKTIEG
jgi:hypothetical protein